MWKFFSPNIGRNGRIVRAVVGITMVLAGLFLKGESTWVCIVLVLSGGFALYEAFRGWCLMRACGIRTKL